MNEKGIKHIVAQDLSPQDALALLVGGVSPRPIALVSTISKDGIDNLAPFSFFNAFGSNPPMVAFCPSRRTRDGTLKDTYHNLLATKECVIQAVTYSMVKQVNITSAEWPPEVSEFEKSGLTPIPSHLVKPKRVLESPFQMECRLKQMIAVGEGKGSGNIAICEVILFHVAEKVLKNGLVYPPFLDVVGRCGGAFYTRAEGSALFELPQPR